MKEKIDKVDKVEKGEKLKDNAIVKLLQERYPHDKPLNLRNVEIPLEWRDLLAKPIFVLMLMTEKIENSKGKFDEKDLEFLKQNVERLNELLQAFDKEMNN